MKYEVGEMYIDTENEDGITITYKVLSLTGKYIKIEYTTSVEPNVPPRIWKGTIGQWSLAGENWTTRKFTKLDKALK